MIWSRWKLSRLWGADANNVGVCFGWMSVDVFRLEAGALAAARGRGVPATARVEVSSGGVSAVRDELSAKMAEAPNTVDAPAQNPMMRPSDVDHDSR